MFGESFVLSLFLWGETIANAFVRKVAFREAFVALFFLCQRTLSIRRGMNHFVWTYSLYFAQANKWNWTCFALQLWKETENNMYVVCFVAVLPPRERFMYWLSPTRKRVTAIPRRWWNRHHARWRRIDTSRGDTPAQARVGWKTRRYSADQSDTFCRKICCKNRTNWTKTAWFSSATYRQLAQYLRKWS